MGHSLTTLKVLRAFFDRPTGAHYGLQLIDASNVNGGALYPILERLERDGWIVGEWEQLDESVAGRRRRRYYSLTAEGEHEARAVLAETAAALNPPAPQHRRKRGERRAWASS